MKTGHLMKNCPQIAANLQKIHRKNDTKIKKDKENDNLDNTANVALSTIVSSRLNTNELTVKYLPISRVN